ncbi:CLUMA_CG005995, isoform A [Clunio marinus]|uniref:CLUMA_CG005995, isoform A n=1 Tax=Clunio marinus TaxID=568069 RepID=A0A1J1HWI0_9DIPT|nr:CLUMA_CG005995, isoform A [Clunio marinus]
MFNAKVQIAFAYDRHIVVLNELFVSSIEEDLYEFFYSRASRFVVVCSVVHQIVFINWSIAVPTLKVYNLQHF